MKEFLVFRTNGDILVINAERCIWDASTKTLDFYDENDKLISVFKLNAILGFSQKSVYLGEQQDQKLLPDFMSYEGGDAE